MTDVSHQQMEPPKRKAIRDKWWRGKDAPDLLSAELVEPGYHALPHLVALRLAGHLRLERLLLPVGTAIYHPRGLEQLT